MAIVQRFCGSRKRFDEMNERGEWGRPKTCPTCRRGRLVRHGGYRRKTCIRWVGRVRCQECGVTHAVLPHFVAPWQRVFTEARQTIVCEWMIGPACGAWP